MSEDSGPPIHDLTGLLAMDCTLEELTDLVDDQCDLDGVLEVDPDGVTFVVDWFWTGDLQYPFTAEQFWQTIEALDEESLEAYEWFDQQDLPDDGLGAGAVHRAVALREDADHETTRTP